MRGTDIRANKIKSSVLNGHGPFCARQSRSRITSNSHPSNGYILPGTSVIECINHANRIAGGLCRMMERKARIMRLTKSWLRCEASGVPRDRYRLPGSGAKPGQDRPVEKKPEARTSLSGIRFQERGDVVPAVLGAPRPLLPTRLRDRKTRSEGPTGFRWEAVPIEPQMA